MLPSLLVLACSAEDWYACGRPEDCIIVRSGCCETLDDPPLAIRLDAVREYRDAECEREPKPCPLGCSDEPDFNWAATCRAGRCMLIDVAADDALSACVSDSDCELLPTRCNEISDPRRCPRSVVGVSRSGAEDYTHQICRPGGTVEPIEDVKHAAHCVDGHCRLVCLMGPWLGSC